MSQQQDNWVEITINDKPVRAQRGHMLIEAMDQVGIDLPRFCYHPKLSVVANCRMCLVEVQKCAKPLPACATPITDGMIVHTRSKLALDAQRATMSFLLINHPLDCPICDQGGECELQDQAMGYGAGVSTYTEAKRVVFDRSIGPLIATEMTRCIHCTRCVRFGEEIAGMRELGMTGRGEHARIETFVSKNIDSELSGNIIDLCPVGALTAKPSRYSARAWELQQHASIAPHDCLGSNIALHTHNNRVVRVVPRERESINETWLSDRDRFSYEAVHSADRLNTPMVKRANRWHEASWEEALKAAAKALQGAGKELATLVSPIATLEEMYLAQALTRALGSDHIDHRLRQADFRDQAEAPIMPWLGMAIEDMDTLSGALLIGANPQKEQPIAAQRLRKAALAGGQINLLNPREYTQRFPLHAQLGVRADRLVHELAAIARALGAPTQAVKGLGKINVKPQHQTIADSLAQQSKQGSVWIALGSTAFAHPELAALRRLAQSIAIHCGAHFGYLPEAGNTAGAWLSGCVPHRGPGGTATKSNRHVGDLLAPDASERASGYLLLGVEPDLDTRWGKKAVQTIGQSKSVVALTCYDSESLRACAKVMLPMGTFCETSGTLVNAAGNWQSFRGAIAPHAQSRPGWKILRALGSYLQLPGFAYDDSNAVRASLMQACADIALDNLGPLKPIEAAPKNKDNFYTGDVPIYAGDPMVRRAASLQRTHDAQTAHAISPATAKKLGIAADKYPIQIDKLRGNYTVVIDPQVPDNCLWIPLGTADSAYTSVLIDDPAACDLFAQMSAS